MLAAARQASNRARSDLFFMHTLHVGADCPHRFLLEDTSNGRHVDAAATGRPVPDAVQEDLVAFILDRR